jgi:hypothetical protein
MCTFPFITKDSTAHQRLADQTIKCHLATFCHGPQFKNLYKNAPFGASSCGVNKHGWKIHEMDDVLFSR